MSNIPPILTDPLLFEALDIDVSSGMKTKALPTSLRLSGWNILGRHRDGLGWGGRGVIVCSVFCCCFETENPCLRCRRSGLSQLRGRARTLVSKESRYLYQRCQVFTASHLQQRRLQRDISLLQLQPEAFSNKSGFVSSNNTSSVEEVSC